MGSLSLKAVEAVDLGSALKLGLVPRPVRQVSHKMICSLSASAHKIDYSGVNAPNEVRRRQSERFLFGRFRIVSLEAGA